MRRLADHFFTKASKDVDKWEQYVAIYERYLSRFVESNMPARLLEIGVQNGGSLELWHDFLPAGSSVLGLDIDPAVASLQFSNDQITAHVLDATDKSALDDCLAGKSFDVIIDDGSHTSGDIIQTFQVLFPYLRPGGLFFIEDLHCSYFASHDGGFAIPHSSIEWLKRLADAVNFDHINPQQLTLEQSTELRRYNRSIAGISFYDSMVVIERFAEEKARPFRRIYSGTEGVVEPTRNWLTTAPFKDFEPMLFGHAAAREIDLQMSIIIQERAARITALEQELQERDATLVRQAQEAQAQAEHREAEIALRVQENEQLKAECAQLKAEAENVLGILAANAKEQTETLAALNLFVRFNYREVADCVANLSSSSLASSNDLRAKLSHIDSTMEQIARRGEDAWKAISMFRERMKKSYLAKLGGFR